MEIERTMESGPICACGSKEFDPPFPFPPKGKAGAGMVPPTPGTLPASQPRWHASMHRLPPQEGAAPLRNPPGLTSLDVLPPPGRPGGELNACRKEKRMAATSALTFMTFS